MKCPQCGTESDGRYCPSCGTQLRGTHCAHCGADLVPGARFCTQCGRAVGAGAGTGSGAVRAGGAAGAGARHDEDGGGSNTAWYIAAGILGLVILVLLVPMLRGGDDGLPPGVPLGESPGAAPPPLTGTPREQADRLFNRIMAAREQGDMDEARFFAPMGIQAYQAAEPLDADGLYHLATIQVVAGDHAAALATSERILSADPNHLLGLAVAAEASELAGDSATARAYHRRFLDAYDSEIARGLTEYQDHARILPEYRAAAERAGGG